MLARSIGLGAVLASSVVLLSCGSEGEACTLLGCESFFTIQATNFASTFAASEPWTMRLCIDSVCADFQVSGSTCERLDAGETPWPLDCRVEGGDVVVSADVFQDTAFDRKVSHTVSIAATDAQGSSLATEVASALFQELYPNGPECDETPCYQATVTVTP